jgi:hypothetical protein
MAVRHQFGRLLGRPGLFVVAFLACMVLGLLADTTPVEATSDRMGQATAPPTVVFLPAVLRADQPPENVGPADPGSCPAASDATYLTIPIEGGPGDHPDALHGDLNLALRGYTPTGALLALISMGGDTDPNAPQFPGIFADQRTPHLTSAYRVYEWDWSCGVHGCRSSSLTANEVTLIGMGSMAGEQIFAPSRGPEIYGGGFAALVLYAEEHRITLGYTRRDSVAPGYAVHLESICVDPNLLQLYRESNAAGRRSLPALHNGDALGTAWDQEVLVAIRDRGTFMDPRSRKDWWRGR